MKRFFAYLIVIAGLGACSAEPPSVASSTAALTDEQCMYFATNGKVRICHRTRSCRHPYVILRVSENACVNAHAGHPEDYVAVGDPTCQGGGCLPGGAPVDDTLPCCSGLVAQGGVCVDLCEGVTCQPQDDCHVAGTCDQETGTCSNPNAPDGTSCNDDDPASSSDTCLAGECGGICYQ